MNKVIAVDSKELQSRKLYQSPLVEDFGPVYRMTANAADIGKGFPGDSVDACVPHKYPDGTIGLICLGGTNGTL